MMNHPGVILAMSEDSLGCDSRGERVLLASGEQRPGALLDTLHCTEQSPQ